MGGSRSDFCFRHFLCNKIKSPTPDPYKARPLQSPTPDPSPVGRGVDTVVSCALLLSNIIGYYTLLSNVAVG